MLTVHMACHARAQNMGQKAAEMLRLIPQATVKVIERCSGHGGSWGFKKDSFEAAMKVGRPVARQVAGNGPGYVMSECPLAGVHIQQGMEKQTSEAPKPVLVSHPVQLLARSYGFGSERKG
jgi:glycerol-3-phosphate dehydrogenase subunit C